MTLFNNRYRVEPIRIKKWDYSSPGCYFVTIDTYNMFLFFGNIGNNGIKLSETGKIAQKFWLEIPEHFKNVFLDEFIVMPNHVHGIIIIGGGLDGDVCHNYHYVEPCHGMALHNSPPHTPHNSPPHTPHNSPPHTAHNSPPPPPNYRPRRYNQFSKPISGSLSMIINQYKSSVTRWCRKNGLYDFGWQGRFYERIIRDQFALNRIRRYITKNPDKWRSDRKNNIRNDIINQ